MQRTTDLNHIWSMTLFELSYKLNRASKFIRMGTVGISCLIISCVPMLRKIIITLKYLELLSNNIKEIYEKRKVILAANTYIHTDQFMVLS